MTAPQPVKLIKRVVDSRHVSSGDSGVWDRDLPGFGMRVDFTGRKVWCVQVRGASGKPEPTLADLAEQYMESHVRVNCSPRSISTEYGCRPYK